ncbi:unnamed protein product [Trypanosoma congolense IL3000]|uniref:WGS project CAEQ00000000 data, annotated contig 2259 n=1 Tax=Trypanosoma congolense (strain IL3000) TaxID=1068625 RepID=F9WCR1_TRYCI|nr:unnamed protein product [Trypanosoma congolense IL3000]
MQSKTREMLLKGMKHLLNLNISDFLRLYYMDVKKRVARFTVEDLRRHPERRIKDKDRRKDIGMSMSRMRSRLRDRLLRTSWDLFSYHIKTLEDWTRKGSPKPLDSIARGLLNQALRNIQELVHIKHQAIVPSSSSSPSKHEGSPTNVGFLGVILLRRRKSVPPPQGEKPQQEMIIS